MNQIAIRFSDSTERTISVDWRVRITAESRLSVYRACNLELEKPPLTWMSIGRSRYPQTRRFRDLEPGVDYRIVADALGEVKEVVATTRMPRP
jgi:hypothetical protein